MPTIKYCDYLNGVDAARSQAYTNDPAAGSNILLTMADTTRFVVNASVTVSSSAGSETATITAVDPNVSITVASLALDHTTTSPLVTLRQGVDVVPYGCSSPYKTITQASTGLTGGDEVRCAKSPDVATLSGTLTFTNASKTVNTSQDLTAVLGAKDFVSLNTTGETWWEITSITSSAITLAVKYYGAGGTGTGYKRGITGSIAGVTVANGTGTTAVQTVSASGTSAASLLKISGGWNLSGTPAQDGQTFFFQSNTTKGGRGLYGSTISYVNIDGARLGFLRYYSGIYIEYSSVGWTITSVTCNGSNAEHGIYLKSGCTSCILTSCCVCGGIGDGIHVYASNSITVTSCVCNGNSYGIYFEATRGGIVTSCTFNGNYVGIYITSSSFIIFTSCTCNASTTYAVTLTDGSFGNVAYNLAHNQSVWTSILNITSWDGIYQKFVSVQESYSGTIRNRVYDRGGYIESNTPEARTGSCLQFNTKYATPYWTEQSFFVRAAASTARTVTIYAKKDGSFNGTVFLELWFNGVLITGPTDVSSQLSASYAQLSIVGASGGIPVDGVLEMKVKVYGTAGCVYVDDLGYS